MTLTRNDWCVAAGSGTVFIAGVSCCIVYAIGGLHEFANFRDSALIVISLCNVVSMLAFVNRAFCRLPKDSALAAKPIRKGMITALLGGSAYGACVAFGLTLAAWHSQILAWEYEKVTMCLLFQATVIVAAGLMAIPVGLVGGVIFSVHKRFSRKTELP